MILDDGGEISSCDLNHIAAVDEDMALEYGKQSAERKVRLVSVEFTVTEL